MLAEIPRRPFSLHALVAEAKRRARRRRALLAVAVIAVGGGVAGAVWATHASGRVVESSAPATRTYPASAVHYRPGYLVTCAGCAFLGASAPAVTVSASSRDAAWVVGSDVAWRWDGRAWQSVPLPPGTDLHSVTSVGPDDAWAVGAGATIEHWDGTKWTDVPTPSGLDARSTLSSVSASGPSDVWALGTIPTGKGDRSAPYAHKERPLLLHWNGTEWLRQALPWATRGRIAGEKVVATGPSSVWVVVEALGSESSVIEHWNGTSWQAVPAPFGRHDPVLGFSATAWNDAWAVGSYAGARVGISRPLAAHWDGSAWRFAPVPTRRGGHKGSLLTDVVSVRPDDVWAIGQIQPVHPNEAFAPRVFMVHWDGSSWTVTPGSAQSYFFSGATIAAAPDGTAWAITNCGDDNVVLGWNGTHWRVVPHPPDQQWTVQGPARSGGMRSCASGRSGG